MHSVRERREMGTGVCVGGGGEGWAVRARLRTVREQPLTRGPLRGRTTQLEDSRGIRDWRD